MGRFFTIRTDHKSLKELFHQVIQTPEQQFYVQKLLGYTFSIEYKTGASNLAVDALSRRGEESVNSSNLLLISRPMSTILQQIRSENNSLHNLVALHAKAETETLPSNYSVR